MVEKVDAYGVQARLPELLDEGAVAAAEVEHIRAYDKAADALVHPLIYLSIETVEPRDRCGRVMVVMRMRHGRDLLVSSTRGSYDGSPKEG
jgi:hypothetical protein